MLTFHRKSEFLTILASASLWATSCSLPGHPGCTKDAKKSACIKSGDSYKTQHFDRDPKDNCKWKPDEQTLTIVDPKFCDGTSGSAAKP